MGTSIIHLSSLTDAIWPRSLTDTSYFPTEDLNEIPEQPVGTDAGSGSKDLAFLGYTVRSIPRFILETGADSDRSSVATREVRLDSRTPLSRRWTCSSPFVS